MKAARLAGDAPIGLIRHHRGWPTLALLLLLLAGAWVHGQGAEDQAGVVSGRISDAATGAPLRSATIRLRRSDGRDTRVATTDAQGFYRIDRLGVGQWSLSASKSGFVTRQFGQTSVFDLSAPFSLSFSQRFTANLGLLRAGAIAGHVLDQFGDPVVGARVQVLRSRLVRGFKQAELYGTGDATDDTGAFRVHGLPPGEYHVVVTLKERQPTPLLNLTAGVSYYPAASRFRDAERVKVEAGVDAPSITIMAPPQVRGVSVSGIVTNAAGSPVSGAEVQLNEPDAPALAFMRGYFAGTDRNGRFTLDNIPPGEYRLEAMTLQTTNRMNSERGVMVIDVPQGGLSTVALTTSSGSTLVATVVASAGSTLPIGTRIGLSAQREGGAGTTMIQTGLPLALQMPGLFGQTRLAVESIPPGWGVEALEINGRDVLDSGVDFTGLGSTVTGRIVLTDRLAEVSGAVALRADAPNAAVIVFPDHSGRWTYPSASIRVARLDREGRYTITGLPPSNAYRAVALTVLDEQELQDPEFLERLRPRSTELRLERGARKTLDLQAIVR